MSTNLLPDDVRKERVKGFLTQGRLEEAREMLSELCRDDQRDVEIWFMKSTVSGHLKQYEDVIAACRKALEIEADYLPAITNLASALAALGRHQEAVAEFANVLRIAPDNPVVLGNYGHALLLAGRRPEAREALEKAVRIQPHYAEAHYNLAVLLDHSGLAEEALRAYEQAIALKPGLPHLNERVDALRKIVRGKA